MQVNVHNTDGETVSGRSQTDLRGENDSNAHPASMDGALTAATVTTTAHRLRSVRRRILSRTRRWHQHTPYLRRLPFAAIAIITLLVLLNLIIWTVCGLVLTRYPHLLSTAALAYSLGLRHALDADHISAIDLMTRRLVASGQRPVTVGTFFSLGHSTIVVVTSIVVAATAAGVSHRFDGFSKVGGIIGSSVSAAFLILLGIMNAYILYKLLVQLKKVIHLQPEDEASEAFKFEGGGVLFRLLKKMFKLIDRPWKMYPLGVLFGLGFDTSSEVALLGISSIQGARGTSMWLILIFPVLFTVGMCLVDTIDGALMMSLYVAPMGLGDLHEKKETERCHQVVDVSTAPDICVDAQRSDEENIPLSSSSPSPQVGSTSAAVDDNNNARVKSPLTFLYYSSVLTLLTVIVALVIGTIQLLTLILNVAVSEDEAENSAFWTGVGRAGDYYDVIGGAICGAFVIFGLLSVACYKPWRRWVDRVRAREREQRTSTVVVVNAEEATDASRPSHNSNAVVDGQNSLRSKKQVRSEVFELTRSGDEGGETSRTLR